ncbi:hypothetical protein Asi03nite_12490 [Actinoplanes siamensis]|uniref:Uncharacterized protein n=1 Tax=Actinoplanes siamensis TaxID=1223317 RepID=A0A919TH47_9ACTN|nr:hypothetical protein Asi03nite_12490 [Actinoplanes siamensis]
MSRRLGGRAAHRKKADQWKNAAGTTEAAQRKTAARNRRDAQRKKRALSGGRLLDSAAAIAI